MTSPRVPSPRILVVDDTEDSLLCTIRLLQKAGYETDRAVTGGEALESARAHRPSLILLDVHLPDIDGRDLCQQIKADAELTGIFVVLFSSERISSDDQTDGFVKGADGYIARPIENREFLARVAALLRIQQTEQQLHERSLALEAANRELTAARQRAEQSAEALRREIAERLRGEAALRESERQIRAVLETVSLFGVILDQAGRIKLCNNFALEATGWKREEVINQDWFDLFLGPEIRDHLKHGVFLKSIRTGDIPAHLDNEIITRSGERRWVAWNNTILRDEAGVVIGVASIGEDITQRRDLERRQTMTIQILSRLKELGSPLELVSDLIKIIKTATGLEAIGLRFQSEGDFPYYVQDGFSEDFVRKENRLCCRGSDGSRLCDQAGRALLECTCGLVLSGKTISSNALFTPGGSFWSNDTTPLLDYPADQDPRLHPRNHCIKVGYKSVALIPIRVEQEIVGLFQFNDHRTGRFTLKMVEFYEGIAASIGSTLAKLRAVERLQESERKFNRLFQSNPHPTALTTVQEGRILEANESYCRYFSSTREELIGRTVLELNFWANPEDRERLTARLLERGCELEFETRFRLPSGEVRDVLMSSELIELSQQRVILSISQDITERKRAEQALSDAHGRLRQLSRRLIDIQETERRSLSRNLHDGLGQTLAAAKIRLHSLIRFPDPEHLAQRLDESVGVIDQVLQQVRQISLLLRPPLLDEMGLSAALRWLVNQRIAGELPVDFSVPENLPRFSSEMEITVFRVAQEALTNVARHAQARHARLMTDLHADALVLIIVDDGVGFDVAAARRRACAGESLGVLGMEERVHLLGGRLELESQPGLGTEVRAWLPLTPPAPTQN